MELKLYCGSLNLGKRLGLNLKSPSQAHFTNTWLPVCGGVLKIVGTVGGGVCLVAQHSEAGLWRCCLTPHSLLPVYSLPQCHLSTPCSHITSLPCLPHYDSQDPLKLWAGLKPTLWGTLSRGCKRNRNNDVTFAMVCWIHRWQGSLLKSGRNASLVSSYLFTANTHMSVHTETRVHKHANTHHNTYIYMRTLIPEHAMHLYT